MDDTTHGHDALPVRSDVNFSGGHSPSENAVRKRHPMKELEDANEEALERLAEDIGIGADAGTRGWLADALCAQTDPEAFFPEKGGSVREAKRICRVCRVQRECLTFALEHDIRFGIWGGLSDRERRRIHAQLGYDTA